MIITIKMLIINLLLVFNLQVSDGSELLKELQDKYNTIEDFTASFRQTTGAGQVLQGKFHYKKVDKFRIELDSRTLVSDGESIWNYSPKNNKVIITPVEDNTNSFSINDFIYEYPKNCQIKQYDNENGTKTLWFKPKSTDEEFKEVKLVVNSNNLIDEIEVTDLADQSYKVYLTNTKINQKLSEKLFSFETSKGMQVIDLR